VEELMKLNKPEAEIYVPDGIAVEPALARTTQMAFAAHQDDLEIMSFQGILQCFGKDDEWYTGVVVTNGAGSPRDDLYANYTDEEMRKVRKLEQKKAAFVGEYAAQALLDYTSSEVKDAANTEVVDELVRLLEAAKPEVVYTHNLADKHDTHVGVAVKVVQAVRKLSPEARPKKLYGCEVWRGLDWMNDEDKVVFDVDAHENIAAAVLGVFDSQICGGKRYDLATLGRRRGYATYYASHGTDSSGQLAFSMDLTPLMMDPMMDIKAYVDSYVQRFAQDVASRLGKLV
jgi:LmbE family N-acetylglucosaminyl deacetylase